MKTFLSVLLIVLGISNTGFPQDFPDRINELKGKPVSTRLKVYKGKVRHHSGWHYEYTYSDDGKVKTQRNFHRNNLTAECEYKYDSIGNKVMEVCLDIVNKKGKPEIFNTKYSYDTKGRIKKQTLLFHDNKVMWIKDSLNYSDNHQLISFIKKIPVQSDKTKDTYEKYILSYTKEGMLKTSEIEDNFGSSSNVTYSYNEKGDVSAIETRETVILNMQEQQSFRSYLYRYKYDKHGNWIKRYTRFNGGKEELEVSRKIKYM